MISFQNQIFCALDKSYSYSYFKKLMNDNKIDLSFLLSILTVQTWSRGKEFNENHQNSYGY